MSEINNYVTSSSNSKINGERTSFWKDTWMNGAAPNDIAPICFCSGKKKKTHMLLLPCTTGDR
jgi:hypothetical protein